jgi:hypothetical protein
MEQGRSDGVLTSAITPSNHVRQGLKFTCDHNHSARHVHELPIIAFGMFAAHGVISSPSPHRVIDLYTVARPSQRVANPILPQIVPNGVVAPPDLGRPNAAARRSGDV